MWPVWLAFCDCGFQSVCPLMRRIRGLWKLPHGRDWLRGKLGIVLMDGARLSKSLIQFSVDGWSCVPSLLFTWGQSMVEVMKIMATSFMHPTRVQCFTQCPEPHSRPLPTTLLLETPGHPQAGPGQPPVGSLLLSPGPGAQASVVPSESLSPRPEQVLAALWWG